jgi:hypothetical protein
MLLESTTWNEMEDSRIGIEDSSANAILIFSHCKRLDLAGALFIQFHFWHTNTGQ